MRTARSSNVLPTGRQAGRQIEILCRHSTQATTRGSLSMYRIVLYIVYVDTTTAVQVPPHTPVYTVDISLFLSLTQT